MISVNLKFTILSFVLIYAISTANAQGIPQFIPHAFEGFVYFDDQPATAGTKITVKITNTDEVVGEGTVVDENGSYILIVIFENEVNNATVTGAKNGDRLTWHINGNIANLPKPGQITAQSGEFTKNFNIISLSGEPVSEEIITSTLNITPSVEEKQNISPTLLIVFGIILGLLLSYIMRRR